MPPPRLWERVVGELVRPRAFLAHDQLPPPRSTRLTGRDLAVDAAGCAAAAVLGALFLSPTLRSPDALGAGQVVLDVGCGLVACVGLWWRRRWALAVAVGCLVLGTLSISATPAGLLALFSLAVHRPVRPTLLVTALWIPSLLIFALYSPTTDLLSVLLRVIPLVLAVTAWGMFIRARRQLLSSLRDRTERAEADQRQHEDRARMAERTRIAREMHDVLAHRISLIALHAGALEVRPDLSTAEVRACAALLRSTSRQALEELRTVIGVLREDAGPGGVPPLPQPALPPPTLGDIRRLVSETREAGVEIDFEMQVERTEAASGGLGRDAYRIVQEALTNVGKHASGVAARVRVTGAPGRGLQVSVRSAAHSQVGSTLPGSGAGLVGLRERVDLAGGVLVHGPDGSGDFVVEAELPWPP